VAVIRSGTHQSNLIDWRPRAGRPESGRRLIFAPASREMMLERAGKSLAAYVNTGELQRSGMECA